MAVKEIVINSLEELAKYIKDDMLELVSRDRKKKFTDFQKFVINKAQEPQSKERLEEVIKKLNQNNKISEKNFKAIKNLTKLQNFNLILSGLSLCATCAGFMIMFDKLDKMSGKINQILGTLKQSNDVRASYEFDKIISEHNNMLDARKTQKYYSEEQMRQLVDDEYNYLNMLIKVFMMDLTEDKDSLIFSIFSVANMMAASLTFFDELYYFNNKDVIGDGDVWHTSHDSWMSVFKTLASDEFMVKLQDYAIFEHQLSTFEADYYYLGLKKQIKDLVSAVEDKQKILVLLNDEKLMAAYHEYIRQSVSQDIKEAFEQTEGAMEDPEVVRAYQDGMKQMALAV